MTAIVGAASIVLVVLAATERAHALPCDTLPSRLHGKGPAALRALWRELGVRSTLYADDATVAPLHASRDTVALGGRDESYVVLTITDARQSDWQYLVFLRRQRDCRYLGAIDAPAQTLEKPGYRLAALPDRRTALVTRTMMVGGTGIALYRETWHRADHRSLAAVLQYPVRGYIIGWPSAFDREFTTTVDARERGGEVTEVTVEFAVSYATGSYVYWEAVEPLFSVTRRARYAWDRAAGRFVLDLARSEIFQEEIDGIFADAEEQFLAHNLGELRILAREGNERQRAWLRRLLDDLRETPEASALMEALR
jgi:hypothetical protein